MNQKLETWRKLQTANGEKIDALQEELGQAEQRIRDDVASQIEAAKERDSALNQKLELLQ